MSQSQSSTSAWNAAPVGPPKRKRKGGCKKRTERIRKLESHFVEEIKEHGKDFRSVTGVKLACERHKRSRGNKKTEKKKGKKRALRKKEMDACPSNVELADLMFEIGEKSIARRGQDKKIVAADKFAQAKKAEAKDAEDYSKAFAMAAQCKKKAKPKKTLPKPPNLLNRCLATGLPKLPGRIDTGKPVVFEPPDPVRLD